MSWDLRWEYLAPVVSLLMRRVETFAWLLDAVKADKIPLVVVSNTKRGRIFMTELRNRRAACGKDRAQQLQKWGWLEYLNAPRRRLPNRFHDSSASGSSRVHDLCTDNIRVCLISQEAKPPMPDMHILPKIASLVHSRSDAQLTK